MDSQLISANDFMVMLERRGLVIGKAEDFESVRLAKLQALQQRLMKRKKVTIKEIVDAELLPLKSKKGVCDWIERQKIKPEEVIRGSTDKAPIHILTSAIRRLGYI